MLKKNPFWVFKPLLILIFMLAHNFTIAQQSKALLETKSDFWKNVQFGGGFGLTQLAGEMLKLPDFLLKYRSKIS